MTMHSNNTLKALIVAYKPDLDILLPNLTLLASIANLNPILYLNSANSKDVQIISSYIDVNRLNLQLDYSEFNNGLSLPYNKYSKLSVQDINCAGILFLDQDSVYTFDSLSSFIYRFFQFIRQYPLGIYAGLPIDPRLSKPYRLQRKQQTDFHLPPELVSTYGACSSMSIITRRAFLRCGFFDERFFIDLIDYEFCLRVSSNNLLIIVDSLFHFDHPIGTSTISLPFNSTQPVSSPFRHYYQIRNLFFFPWLSFTGLCRFPYELFKRFCIIILITIYTRDPSRFIYTLRGLFHGIFLKGGKM